MSTARFGRKWADVDEDDEEGMGMESPKSRGARFETPLDANGVKTVIEYTERDGKTYKVTRKVKQTSVTNWTNRSITDRKSMAKFGKPAINDAASEKQLIARNEEEVPIELSKKLAAQPSIKDDAEDKFYEESLSMAENLTREKKVWTDMNRERQLDRDSIGGITRDTTGEGEKPAEGAEGGETTTAGGPPASKYVPPSLRQGAGKGDGKGKGDMNQGQEASLRITNLSEDVREGDLQDLFGQCGRLQRVYLAKDMTTYQSRGFAFVTYYTREDAQKAINKLNGHGYDNLILQVQFAKPRQ
jgi:translation initiation factor 3 subunit G